MKSLRLVTSALSVLLALLLLTSVAAASATYLISYGDSLSDNGNLFAFDGGTYPPPPYWMGRMSNGPVMVEYLAQHTGLQLLDFSWIGATTGVGNYVDGGTQTTFGTFGLPGMLTQLAGTIGTITPIASQSVAVVWGGPNDFLTNGFSTATAQLAVNDILSIVATLKGIGMMEIIVPGMPDLSLTPDYYGDLGAQALSIYFNQLLVAGLPQGAQYFNTFAFMHQVVADPGAYGLTDVRDPCFDGVNVCSNPNQYLFWDGFHPTTAADAILANAVQAAALPEPSTLLLLGSGAIGLGGLLRRRLPL